MMILDSVQKKIVANHVRVAKHLFDRLRGLIGFPPLRPGEALQIPLCQCIHTFGLTYSIDVIFLDRNNTVIRIASGIKPNSISSFSARARSVVELSFGTIEKLRIKHGDQFEFFETECPQSDSCKSDCHRSL